MGNNSFKREYQVAYSEISSKGRLKISGLANYFQSLAVTHSGSVGYPVERLREEHLGWVLICWQIKISGLPADEENITVETWSRPYRHAQADRDFCLRDKNGKEIVYASSRWIIMDTERRRPARMDPDFFLSYSVKDSRDIAEADYSIRIPGDAELLSEEIFEVRRRDTDTNGHVNNAVYVDWAMDTVPDELYDAKDPKELRVLYKKECRRGDRVLSVCRRHGSMIYDTFASADDPKSVYCIVSSDWG